MKQVAQASELPSVNLDVNFTDSRDFSVLLTYTEDKVSSEQVKATFEAELQRLKVRGVIGFLLDDLILSQGEGMGAPRAARIDELLLKLAQYAQEDYSRSKITQVKSPTRIYSRVSSAKF